MKVAWFLFTVVLASATAAFAKGDGHNHGDDHGHEALVTDHVTRIDGLEILHAWTRATTGDVAQIFMEITNVSLTEFTLLGGETDIGGAVAVRAIDYTDGAEAVDLGRFPIKPRSEIDLTPDGLFLEVADLDMELMTGTSFKMHLDIDPIGEVEIIVEVEAENAGNHSHAGHTH